MDVTVGPPHYRGTLTHRSVGDIEVEEIDLGVQGDLAVDVDGSVADEDPEGLDSDSEDEEQVDKELGIDLDDVEGGLPRGISSLFVLTISQYQCISSPSTLCCPVRNS